MSSDGKEKEVFYASLYPSVLKKYIDEKEEKLAKKKTRPKTPTLSIVFTKLEDNADVLYRIVKQFSIEKRKQGTGDVALVKDMIMLKDIDKKLAANYSVNGDSSSHVFPKSNVLFNYHQCTCLYCSHLIGSTHNLINCLLCQD